MLNFHLYKFNNSSKIPKYPKNLCDQFTKLWYHPKYLIRYRLTDNMSLPDVPDVPVPPGTPAPEQNANRIPVLRPEYVKMIPTFSGEPLLLTHFIDVCDKLYDAFHDNENETFQNYFLFDSILAKITGKATDIVFSNNVSHYGELRDVLLANFSDKRDFFTLISEMSRMNQKPAENCFGYHQRVVNLLNVMIAYLQINKIDPTRTILTDFARGYALRTFINGLQESTASLLRARKCESLDEVLRILQNEFNFASLRNQPSNLFPRNNFSNGTPNQVLKFNKTQNFSPNSSKTPGNESTSQNQSESKSQWKPNSSARPWQPNNQYQRSFSTPGQWSTPRNNARPFQRQLSYGTNKPSTSTPRNFHMLQTDENPPEPENQDTEDSAPNGAYVPGFFDGNNFYPYEFNSNFENLAIEESPEVENEGNTPFLEEPQES